MVVCVILIDFTVADRLDTSSFTSFMPSIVWPWNDTWLFHDHPTINDLRDAVVRDDLWLLRRWIVHTEVFDIATVIRMTVSYRKKTMFYEMLRITKAVWSCEPDAVRYFFDVADKAVIENKLSDRWLLDS